MTSTTFELPPPRGWELHRLPLVFAVLLLAASGPGSGSSPAHPRSCVLPCAAPRDPEPQGARRVARAREPAGPAARCRVLTARIGATLERGWADGPPEHSERRLQDALVDLLLDAGLLEEALGTLSRLDADCDQWMHAGWRLERGEQPALAVRAYREAGRRDENSGWAFESLVEHDPGAALGMLERSPRWFLKLAPGERAARVADLLVRCGRDVEARAALVAALGEEQLGAGFWGRMLELDPALARSELERHALSAEDEGALELLTELLVEAGEPQRAAAILNRVRGTPCVQRSAYDLLESVDPRLAVDALRADLAREPARADAWSRLGELELQAGSLERALDAWQRAFELAPLEGEWDEELWLHRRDAFLDTLGAAVREQNEAYGWEYLGDYLWRSNRRLEAEAAWSEALRLDPEDSGFTRKLELARAGRWPL